MGRLMPWPETISSFAPNTTMRPDHLSFGDIPRVPSAVSGASSAERVALSLPYCLTPTERVIKRSMDIVGALAFFVFLGPLYLVVAFVVLASMGGPVHYWQPRLGQGGRTFRFYKFRSMLSDSDAIFHWHLERNPAERQQWEK